MRERYSTISDGRKNSFRLNERLLIYALKRNEPAKSPLPCHDRSLSLSPEEIANWGIINANSGKSGARQR